VWGKTQVLIGLMLLCAVTFYVHGAGNLMHDGSALIGRLRGSQQEVVREGGVNTDDPVVIKDRLSKVNADTSTKMPVIKVPPADKPLEMQAEAKVPPSDKPLEMQAEAKVPPADKPLEIQAEALKAHALQVQEQEAAKAELQKMRKEAQSAREEAAKAVADAEAARAEAAAARTEAAQLEAVRKKAQEQQERQVAEERSKEERHMAEVARHEAEEHSRDAAEQRHNKPVSEQAPLIERDEGKGSAPAAEEEHVFVPAAAKAGAGATLPADYVNPYDPKPGHVPKVPQQTAPPKLVCDGTMDPFPNQSVDSYEPPAGAQLAAKREWKDKQSAMMARIRAFNKGGLPLRRFIDGEVQTLVLLRIKLFCELTLVETAGSHTR